MLMYLKMVRYKINSEFDHLTNNDPITYMESEIKIQKEHGTDKKTIIYFKILFSK